MRRPWMPPLLLLSLLAACADGASVTTAADPGRQELAERAANIGVLLRAASACGLKVSMPVQDRAARIEAAAIELRQREGGVAARDAHLASLQPPAFDPRQRGRDRAAWCAARQAEIARLDATLGGPDGAALMARAEAALR